VNRALVFSLQEALIVSEAIALPETMRYRLSGPLCDCAAPFPVILPGLPAGLLLPEVLLEGFDLGTHLKLHLTEGGPDPVAIRMVVNVGDAERFCERNRRDKTAVAHVVLLLNKSLSREERGENPPLRDFIFSLSSSLDNFVSSPLYTPGGYLKRLLN